MSRSGYIDDCEYINLWRGAVIRAMNGKRGQAVLKELLIALDSMPVKALAADSLVTGEGEYCALGALGCQRGIKLDELDPEDPAEVAEAFSIATAMVCEIVYMNDEYGDGYKCIAGEWVYKAETPEERWQRMRAWVANNIRQDEKI